MSVISSLQAGLKVNSTGNSLNTGEITFTDPNGLFPIYAATAVTSGSNGLISVAAGQLMTGGAYLTVNPAPSAPGTISTLLKGQALTLAIEYNSTNQFRFDLTPVGSTMISSPWLNSGTEHSVGVSYDTTSGLTVLSVDGSSQSSFVNYTTTGTTAPTDLTNTFGTNSGIQSPAPTFNGYLGQVAFFNQAPSITTLNSMTADPVNTSASLSGHLETQTAAFGTIVKGASYAGGTITLNSTLNNSNGIEVGDVITDLTNPTTSSTVTAITGANALTVSGAPVISAGETILFTHPGNYTSSIDFHGMTVNSSVVTLVNGAITGVMVGDMISGFNIPAGDTVTSINPINGNITLSSPVGSSVISSSSEPVVFFHPSATSNVVTPAQTTVAGAVISNLGSTQGIQIGDVVIGSSATGAAVFPANDHVVAVNQQAGTVTLGVAATSNGTTPSSVTFVHSTYTNTAGVTGVSGASILSVAPNLGIQVGDIVNDKINPANTKNEVVTAVSPTGDSVTLSAPTTGATGTDSLNFTHTTSSSTTGSSTGSTTLLTVANGAGVLPGDILVDNTSPTNAISTGSNNFNVTVSGVNGNLVTLSSALPNAFTNDSLTFTHPPSVTVTSPANTVIPPATTGTTVTTMGYQLATSNSSLLYVNNTNAIQAGDFVFGPNIPNGDTVASNWVASNTPTVTLTSATTLTVPIGSNITFVHQTSPNIQVVTINSSNTSNSSLGNYKAGDTITITAPITANTFTSATYTVANSDVSTVPATTLNNIAKSFAAANPSIGAFNLIYNTSLGNQIELVPNTGTAQVLPLVTVTSSDSAGLNENTISNFYNFSTPKSASTTTTGANGISSIIASTYDSTGTTNNPTSVAPISYAVSASTGATAQAHGPVYAELVSLNGTTAIYNLFVDGSSVPNGTLSNVGMTINVPTTQASITSITPSAGGTISQVNNTGNGAISYQWASNAGITNLSAPIGQLTLSLTSNAINSIGATMTNLSVNNVNYKDPVQNVPMLENSALNSQVYTVSGHFFEQFNPIGAYGLTNQGTPFGNYTTQVALPNNDFSYTVAGSGTADLKFNVEQNNLVPVSQSAPNSNIALDLVATSMPVAWSSAKAMPFTVTIDVPSNATGVTFNPGTGVTLTSSNTTVGHTLTLSGTYSAPSGKGAVGTSTPTLGVLSATLTNEFNNGGQFSMDTVSINGNASVGQSLYFGMGEANAAGAYTISNLPAGSLSIKAFNNLSQVNPSTISVSDVMAVMSIAAGKGVPGGLGQPIGTTANLLPSDFVAADYNQDGQVTAADALSMLNYIVSVNKANTPGFTYISATGNTLVSTTESTTSVVGPAITPVATNLSSSNAVLVTGDSSKVVDIIGVLPGNVVNY